MEAHCNPSASADCGGDENGVAAPSRRGSSSKRVGFSSWRRSANGSIQSLARRVGFTMKLTKDTVAKLALPPGKSEDVVWDDDVPGFGVRLRPHSATYIYRYRHGARQP